MKEITRERLVVEAFGVHPHVHTVQWCYDFLEDLSVVADMRILTPPQVVKVPVQNSVTPTDHDCGISATVIWLESGAQVHTWPEAAFLALDMFSCKSFDSKKIIAYVGVKTRAKSVTGLRPKEFYRYFVPE